MNRESIVAELNRASVKVAEIRSAEVLDVDALSAAVVVIDSCRAELAAYDAKQTVIVETAPVAELSFGRSAADKLAGSPVGTNVAIERTLFADPFGAAGSQDVTHAQVTALVAQPDAPVRFIDTLAVAPATSDAVTYVKETGFTNAAAARIAGSPAAESALAFDKVVEPIANVAHFIRIAEETLADAPALGALIDRRGVAGVRSKLNSQLLATTNATNGVKSIVAAATQLLYTGSIIDAVLSAKSSLENIGFAPSYVAVSAATYEDIMSAKNGAGTYLAAGPFGSGNATLWGLNIVVDSALTGCDALVYDAAGATLHVRDNANVATDRDIVSNLLTVRVQTRAQAAIELPEAFVKLIAD